MRTTTILEEVRAQLEADPDVTPARRRDMAPHWIVLRAVLRDAQHQWVAAQLNPPAQGPEHRAKARVLLVALAVNAVKALADLDAGLPAVSKPGPRRCDCEAAACHPNGDCSNPGTVRQVLYGITQTVCEACAAGAS